MVDASALYVQYSKLIVSLLKYTYYRLAESVPRPPRPLMADLVMAEGPPRPDGHDLKLILVSEFPWNLKGSVSSTDAFCNGKTLQRPPP
jgi:hypothetical protein